MATFHRRFGGNFSFCDLESRSRNHHEVLSLRHTGQPNSIKMTRPTTPHGCTFGTQCEPVSEAFKSYASTMVV